MSDNNPNPERSESQREQIKMWFLRHPDTEITGLEALRFFGCMEFPKRISELVAMGFNINRDKFRQVGEHTRVKAYYLPREDAEQYMKTNNIKL